MNNETKTSGKKNNFTLIVGLVLGALGVILILQNTHEVDFWLWFWKIRTSLIVLLAITFASGILLAWLPSLGTIRQLKKHIKALEKQNKSHPQDISK